MRAHFFKGGQMCYEEQNSSVVYVCVCVCVCVCMGVCARMCVCEREYVIANASRGTDLLRRTEFSWCSFSACRLAAVTCLCVQCFSWSLLVSVGLFWCK